MALIVFISFKHKFCVKKPDVNIDFVAPIVMFNLTLVKPQLDLQHDCWILPVLE